MPLCPIEWRPFKVFTRQHENLPLIANIVKLYGYQKLFSLECKSKGNMSKIWLIGCKSALVKILIYIKRAVESDVLLIFIFLFFWFEISIVKYDKTTFFTGEFLKFLSSYTVLQNFYDLANFWKQNGKPFNNFRIFHESTIPLLNISKLKQYGQ